MVAVFKCMCEWENTDLQCKALWGIKLTGKVLYKCRSFYQSLQRLLDHITQMWSKIKAFLNNTELFKWRNLYLHTGRHIEGGPIEKPTLWFNIKGLAFGDLSKNCIFFSNFTAAALVFEIAPNTRYYQQTKAKHSLNFPQLMCHDAASVFELTMGHCIQWL